MNFRELTQQEAVSALLTNPRSSADLSVRLGKTRIGLLLASHFKKVLVSYPNSPILDSWKSDSEKFGISDEHITYTTHISLPKHNLYEYDCIILDEIDQVSLRVFSYIEAFDRVDHLHGLSGTMPKKGDKAYYLKKLCPVVYSKKLDETTGITNKDYRIYVHMVHPSTKKDIPLSKKGRFWSELDRIRFFQKKYRETGKFQNMLMVMRAIVDSKSKFDKLMEISQGMDRGLVFLETTDQCDRTGLPSYHSKEPDSEKNLEDFQLQKINKLATIGQLKAGISFPVLNKAVILHSYSSNNRTAQKIGRCLQYVEGEMATIHLICLADTMDVTWVENALKEYDPLKVHYI